jgi:hypothetical protein
MIDLPLLHRAGQRTLAALHLVVGEARVRLSANNRCEPRLELQTHGGS